MQKRGLTEKEAEKQLERYGLNEIREISLASPLKIFMRQIKHNYIIYLLFAAAIISFFVGKSITAYTILAVVSVLVFVGFIQEYRAEKAVKALKKMLVPISIVLRDGKEKEISSKELVPNDIIILRTGEKIPADCVILEEKNLLINEAILTGESGEVRKTAVEENQPYSEKNTLFTGTFVLDGKCTAKIIHTGMNTKFGHISQMISTAEKELPLQNKINRISKYMALVAIIFSVLTGILITLGKPISENLLIDTLILIIALAVAAFPEGFPVVLITALSSGAYKMAQKNAIVNRISIIETLGETTVICSDKTGTITKGEMTVKKIFAGNQFINVSGAGYEADGEFLVNEKKISPNDTILNLLLKSAVVCNDAKISRTGEDNIFHVIGTPTEGALLIMAAKAKIHAEDLELKRMEEIPFNSERKMMSVFCRLENKNFIFSKGAPEILLNKCRYIQKHDGIFTLTRSEKEKIISLNRQMTSDCLRTLALAYKKVDTFSKPHFEDELVFLGLAGMEDPPRDEIKNSIKLCMKAGIKVKMITGDNRETALAVSKKIGLFGRTMEGHELDKITEHELSKIVNEIVIFSRVKPEHKIKIVRALKRNGEIVTMTGDGVNDAPALKEAHIGVAMGKNGTEVSREVADLTLKDDNFATIVTAIKEGRTIFQNIRKFVSYQLSCNYAELAILFFGVLLAPFLGWKIPILLALQILFMNLVTDDLPALTLALTPSSPDIMHEKPRKKKHILNKSLMIWLAISGISMALITLAVFFITFNIFSQTKEYAGTTALLTLICVEIASAFNFVSFRKIVSPKSILANKFLFFASALSIAATVLVIYTPLNKIFETVPLPFTDWIIAIAVSISIILFFNLLKYINNKKNILKLEHF